VGSAGHAETSPGGRLRLADLTPHQFLDRLVTVCTRSPVVAAYTVRTLDLDVLSLRVHLVDDSFLPEPHHPCDPASFEQFLAEVERFRFPSMQR
jgi:hypothetical protein